MKGILFTALLAFSATASADIVAVAPNHAGGEILLTDTPCPNNSDGRVVLSTDAGGSLGRGGAGCATILPPGRILVSWDDGGASVFKAFNFTSLGDPPFSAWTRRPAATRGKTTQGHLAKFKR